VPEGVSDGPVSVLVRPEHGHVRAGEAGEGELSATIETVVYSGEATTTHLRLSTGELFKARMANRPSEGGGDLHEGGAAALGLAPGAVTVLRD